MSEVLGALMMVSGKVAAVSVVDGLFVTPSSEDTSSTGSVLVEGLFPSLVLGAADGARELQLWVFRFLKQQKNVFQNMFRGRSFVTGQFT